jgi:hypothetical protein
MRHATCKSRPGFAFTVIVCCEEIPTYEVETERCSAASRTQSSNITLRHARTASLMLASASSSVSPTHFNNSSATPLIAVTPVVIAGA